MKTIKKEELKNKLDNQDTVIIEVLKPEKYKKGHIKGAINIPLKTIATEAKKRFDKDQEIVVYCTDYDCTSSPTAAKKLEEIGFNNVYDYEGGKKEWKDANYPMESGDN